MYINARGKEYPLYQYFGKGKVTYKCRTKYSYTSSWSTAEWSKEISKKGYICILIYKYNNRLQGEQFMKIGRNDKCP